MTNIYYYEGLIGRYCLCGGEEGLSRIWVGNRIALAAADGEIREIPLFREVNRQLDAYFAGDLREFSLPLRPAGTPFQLKVWDLLRQIPYGETITYGQLAARTGDPKASRAVGMANGRNPLPIIVPCHRVIGAGGKLTGYTGGLDIKQALLRLEGSLQD